ncbi:MAG: N-acetyltransferase [Hyphomicrobiales bacterium]|nr:N-acetyltransferase [Hyphomicrobiales bacterium]
MCPSKSAVPDSNSAETTLTVISSLREIDRSDWDACANPPGGDGSADAYNPFLAHDFLWSLEESGSATAETGWLGQHLVLAGADERPAAILPCYLKSHSQGEYVFDAGWADAFERAGGRYYPKLQVSIPFTPVAGRRLLVRPGVDADRNRAVLAHGAATLVDRHGLSSLHVTFADESDWRILGSAGFLLRTAQQYHFFNDGYGNFDDFLAALASRKRKGIRRERRDARADGIEIVHLTGSDLTEAVWDAFFAFYMDTGARKWGRPYLNRDFFSLIGERMADRILLVMAKRGGDYVAGALNFIGSDALYGRYWGTIDDQPFLHFEVCYYQAIDWAIAHGLARVEAGAQGEHKVMRGYRPLTTYSAHWIANTGFRKAVDDYLRTERRQVARDTATLTEYLPFRQNVETEPDP